MPFKRLKSLFGYGPSDTNLPDEQKGKRVRRIGGGTTTGGASDDFRWLEHRQRRGDQAVQRLRQIGEAVKRSRR